ncbi:MAG: ribose-5-phosphate isomerase RpiA [Caldilinea sp.]
MATAPVTEDPAARFKKAAGEYAANLVEAGMVVGLGTGSTAIHAVRRIAARLHTGELSGIVGVATSLATLHAARELGIPLLDDDLPRAVDITIDGADEVDPGFNAIKGGGGALLREKIVAQASRRLVLVVDERKRVSQLGTTWALPVEVMQFGSSAQLRFLAELGATVRLRRQPDGSLFVTDNHNWIVDCRFGPIADPAGLAQQLGARAGIVEHGLFLGLAADLIVAGSSGICHLTASG